jgi:hypothetical protein
MGPHPWTVWTANGAKSATHFNTNDLDAVGLDSGFMGQYYDQPNSQRIEAVWAADGSLVKTEQPSANDAMTNIRTFPAATDGSVVVVAACWSGIHMVPAGMSLLVWRFDATGTRVSEIGVGGDGGCTGGAFAATVDSQDHTFVVVDTGPSNAMGLGARKMMGRWFDRYSNPLTDWFDTGAPETSFPVARPLIGGGALIGANGFQWLASVPKSGQTVTAGAPSWATDGDDVHLVRAGKAYALVPQSGDTISMVAPSGKSCGNVQFAGAKRLQLGLLDGTVMDMGGSDGCSMRWWSGYLH